MSFFRKAIVVKNILANHSISILKQVKLIHVMARVHNVKDQNRMIVLLAIHRMKFYSMMDIVLMNVQVDRLKARKQRLKFKQIFVYHVQWDVKNVRVVIDVDSVMNRKDID